jgi:homoserine dehydrogenase
MSVSRIAILGYGTVGKSFVQLLLGNQSNWRENYGRSVSIETIVKRDWAESDKKSIPDTVHTDTDARKVAEQGNYDILVELIGGTTIARECIEIALKKGKTVVTANKALLSEQGDVVFSLASENNAQIRFEAAVAGAIPIISLLRSYFHSDTVTSVFGILNGTCNYILSEMESKQREFSDVLRDAQDLGYAEADPTADVDGWDAAHKTAILTRLAYGESVQVSDFSVSGIRAISGHDIQSAEDLGYKIRLIGQTRKTDNGLSICTLPTLVPEASAFGTATGPGNAIVVNSTFAGTISIAGPGAGGDATAQAVAADVLAVLRGNGVPANLNTLAVSTPEKNTISTPVSRWYCRLTLPDTPGAMAAFTRLSAELSINLKDLLQHPDEHSDDALVVCTTDEQTEEKIDELKQKLFAEFSDAKFLKMPILRI